MQIELNSAIAALQKGGIILFETDTIIGLSCDATNSEAVKKLIKLKKRNPTKSFIVLVSGDAMLNKHVGNVPEMAWDLIDISEKPITIIYPEGKYLAPEITANDKSVGMRIIRNGFANQLVHKYNKPLVTTSVNVGGSKSIKRIEDIPKSILDELDYVVNLPLKNLNARPSSIIKMEYNGEFKIIRK